MGWFKRANASKVSKPAAKSTPPRSTSISPEPGTSVNGTTAYEGHSLLPGADHVSDTSHISSLSDAPTLPPQAYLQSASQVDQATTDKTTHKTPTNSPYTTAKAQEPCTANSLAHRLATCGHVVWTDNIKACAANCHKSNPKATDQGSNKAYACVACISAILRCKHTNKRRTFEAEMQKFQRATSGKLTEVVIKLWEVEREGVWSTGLLEAREMLESAGLVCREMPLGTSLAVPGAVSYAKVSEVAVVMAVGCVRIYSRHAIPIDAVRIRAQVLLRSERTQARLKGFLY